MTYHTINLERWLYKLKEIGSYAEYDITLHNLSL